MSFESIHNIYFIGIGGIGMSALARYFYVYGKNIAGYDVHPSDITDDLEKMGIKIHFEEDIRHIPSSFNEKSTTLVIYTPAVPPEHKELLFFTKRNYRIMKRAEVLGVLFNAKKGIAIAGTHGKTSVTSMTASILHDSNQGCSAFLGGIIKNISSNLINDEKSAWIVAEADEYDRSFLHLNSDIALVTSVDSDHLDIYSSYEDIKDAFTKFLLQVKKNGKIILNMNIGLQLELKNVSSYTYSLDSAASDFYAKNIRCIDGYYTFDINTPAEDIRNITLHYLGLTNVENAVAAAAAAYVAGVGVWDIAESLSAFEGVRRRFDIQFKDDKQIYIDDYAHHPRELDAIIGSVRKLYPNKKLTGVFQPHLYSRTRDFAVEFARSLSALDEVILLEIYPAREKPLKGVSSQIILDQISISAKTLCYKKELLRVLSDKKFDILLTMGAGDIDKYVDQIKKMLEMK